MKRINCNIIELLNSALVKPGTIEHGGDDITTKIIFILLFPVVGVFFQNLLYNPGVKKYRVPKS